VDALLILGALLLGLLGFVWLVMRGVATSLVWGWIAALPLVNLIFVVCHWQRARQPVGLCCLGLIPLLVALVLIAHQDPQRLQAILELQWLQTPPTELQIKLNGQFNSEPFSPQQGTFADGVLSLREGTDFFARRELLIRGLPLGKQEIVLDVLPSDQQPLPEVEINWWSPDQALPQARRLTTGYSLHLDLQPLGVNRLAGSFHLVMPPPLKTSLSGRIEVFRKGLRFQEGGVNRQLDSRDTLAFVLDDYLQRRFACRDVQLIALPPLLMASSPLVLDIEARIKGELQHLSLSLIKNERSGWTVVGDDVSHWPSIAASPALGAESAQGRDIFSLVMLLADSGRYVNQPLRILSDSGILAQGDFVELDGEGMIVLRQRLNGSGEARFAVSPERVSHIELLGR
jgi:hypothetical protein